jgi:hypothetical protein
MTRKEALLKLVCSGLAAAVLFPLGDVIFPAVPAIGHGAFAALEAVVSATVGFAAYAMLIV